MVNTINNFLLEATQKYDLAMMKISAVMEAAERELKMNYTRAELKVIEESGTVDDLVYLVNEADNGLVDTTKKALRALLSAAIQFFSDMKDKIINIFTKKENKEALDKVEKKLKIFPLLGKKKVLVPNVQEDERASAEAISNMKKLGAKLNSGQEVTSEEIDNVEKTFIEKHKKAIGVSAAVTITLITAIALVKTQMKKTTDVLTDNEKDSKEANKTGEKLLDKGLNPAIVKKYVTTFTNICKNTTSNIVDSTSNILSIIKKTVSSVKKTEVEVKENASELDKFIYEEDDIDLSDDNDPADAVTADEIDSVNKGPWDDILDGDDSPSADIDNDGEPEITENTDIDKLFNDIMEGTSNNDVTSGNTNVEESTNDVFNNLMSEINNLF